MNTGRYIQLAIYFFPILLLCTLVVVPSVASAQTVETWKLVKKEYPVLPAVIMEVTEGRNAGSFVKIRRTQMNNEVVYTTKSVERGTTLCTWVSAFIWDDNLPELIISGQQYNLDVEARFDRREGESCGMGRISVTYGSREEPLLDRSAHVLRIKGGLADPDPGGIAPPIATEIFQVNVRPGYPDITMFTIAIHISDGSVTDEVVALYVYEKVVN
jgi:hypothetical protein